MIALAEQIAEAQRELALRRTCYPAWVKSGTLDPRHHPLLLPRSRGDGQRTASPATSEARSGSARAAGIAHRGGDCGLGRLMARLLGPTRSVAGPSAAGVALGAAPAPPAAGRGVVPTPPAHWRSGPGGRAGRAGSLPSVCLSWRRLAPAARGSVVVRGVLRGSLALVAWQTPQPCPTPGTS